MNGKNDKKASVKKPVNSIKSADMDMNPADMTRALLKWYDEHRRTMPWRALPGEAANVYHVWLSEIMLQQTTVATVKSYFEKFVKRWPTLESLAHAPLDDVLGAWAGLGYYARARNMHKCARVVVADYDGIFPRSAKELEKLPGIGPYTAGAVSAIGYNEPAVVVDGNVERVITRLYQITTVLPEAKVRIWQQTQALTCLQRPGDFAQGMMDLGATICRPQNPQCLICPFYPECQAGRCGDPEAYPVKPEKKKRPCRHGWIFHIQNREGEILLKRRPEKGLLGGMMELPGTLWVEDQEESQEFQLPFPGDWQVASKPVRHVFTHFELHLKVFSVQVETNDMEEAKKKFCQGKWVSPVHLEREALPTVMKKALKVAVK